eukprot:scaffold9242_cov113-Amphora_coffeaeformis.AAC.4
MLIFVGAGLWNSSQLQMIQSVPKQSLCKQPFATSNRDLGKKSGVPMQPLELSRQFREAEMEGLAAGGYRPIADGVVLGRGRAVTVRAEVVANPFDTVEEEVALLRVEGEAPFSKDVVDDLAVAGLDEVDKDCGGVYVREPGAEEGLPFLAHEEHEGCVAGGGVHWAKGHDIEGGNGDGVDGGGWGELVEVEGDGGSDTERAHQLGQQGGFCRAGMERAGGAVGV